MALVLDDRVRETSTTTGTGTLNLDGAVSGFQTFVAGVGNSNTTYYAIVHRSETEWELGLGTVTDASTDTLARTTVISSSNSDSAVSFSSGAKDVFVTLPASKTAVFDTSNNFTIGTGAAGVDYTLTFNGADNDGVLTWMEDEDFFKFSDDITVGVDDTGYDVKFFGATASRYWLWDESADGVVQRGTLTVGVDDTGHDVKFFGATSGRYWLWDESADGVVQLGTLTVGVDDTGHDVKLFGATSGSYALWDESADSLLLTDSTPLKIGDSQDLTLYHDGSNSYITNAVGALKVATETSGIAVTIGHTTSETTIADNATVTGNLSVGGTFDVTGTIDFSDSAITNAGDIQLDSITGDGDTNTSITFSGSDVITITAGGDTQVTFNNGSILPTTDNDIDLGSGSYEFKDAYFDGTVTTDGLTVSSTTNLDGAIQVDNTITVGVDDTGYDVKFFGDTASAYMLWDTSADDLVLAGAAGIDLAGDIDVDGTANLDAVDIDGAVQVDNTITVGADDQGYDIKFFGDTASAYMLWDTSADDLVLAGAAGIDLAGDIDVDGTANLDAVDIDGAVQVDNTITVGEDDTGYDVKFFGDTASAYMLWDTSADDLVLAGAAGIDLAGSIDVDGTANLDNTDIDGTLAVDGTTISLDATTSLNIDNSNTSNGVTIATATSGVPISIGHSTSETTINDNLTVTGDFTVSGTSTTVDSTTVAVADAMFKLAKDQGTSADALDFGFYGQYGVGGTAKYAGIFRDGSVSGDPFTFFDLLQAEPTTTVNTGGTGYDLADIAAGGATFADDIDVDGTTNLDAVDIDGNVQADGTITVGEDDTGYDVKFFGATASAYMLWDESADDLVLAGAAGIDLAGDIDVDGTANLDAVDIDGAVQIDGTVTVGVDGTGLDVKFFGATSGAYLLWDESADKLLTAGGAVVDIVKDKLLIGSTAVTTTAAELNVLDAVTAGTVTASLGVVVDSNKDIGTFRNITLSGELDAGSLDVSGDADIDGTLETDALTIGGTAVGSLYAAIDDPVAMAIALG